jgi:hypothetical protein
MPVGVLAMLMSSGRVLLGLLMLAIGMMVGGLEVVMGGCVMAGRGQVMMLNRPMFVLFWHGCVLLRRKVELEKNRDPHAFKA